MPLARRVNNDPAQPLTLPCFLLDFLQVAFPFPFGSSDEASGMCSADELGELPCLESESEELELLGRFPLGDETPMKGSSPKKDHRFGVFVGLGEDKLLEEELPSASKSGIEFRRRGEAGI